MTTFFRQLTHFSETKKVQAAGRKKFWIPLRGNWPGLALLVFHANHVVNVWVCVSAYTCSSCMRVHAQEALNGIHNYVLGFVVLCSRSVETCLSKRNGNKTVRVVH